MIEPKTSGTETVVFLGSYDRGKPRVRLLIEGATEIGVVVHECHVEIWHDVEDKVQIRRFSRIIRYIFRWIVSRPVLLLSYLRAPPHRSVVLPYPGILDLLFFYPVIKFRGAKILLDAFISIYDTVINDRKLVKENSFLAKSIYLIEWLATRTADMIFLDTERHGDYFADLYNLPQSAITYVPVGVEVKNFPRKSYHPWTGTAPLRVLFYGQFIPLQGTMILLEAIAMWESSPRFPVHWTVIGRGQDSEMFDKNLIELKLSTVRRIDWVPYLQLSKWIEDSDVCCGIFGNSTKALCVVPNKIYQVLAAGRPILTADTPAMRSFVGSPAAIELIQPNDATAIVCGLGRLANRLLETPGEIKNSVERMPIVGPRDVGNRLESILRLVSCE